jgi:hypothetical protein
VTFDEAAAHLLAGDFTLLEPQFRAGADGEIPVIDWHASGKFAEQPQALAEAFTCACFLGAVEVVDYLLARHVNPDGGKATGMTAFHWAANRGQAAVVEKLIGAGASLEEKNRFGGTVLACAVWSLVNEPRGAQLEVIRHLLRAGADVRELPQRTGDPRVDELCAKYRARR